MSSFRALSEVIRERGLFCSLYADRASHYWHTPEAGGTVDKDKPTQVGRALQQLDIELIAAYSPEARGRSERMFGTLQKRLPQELRLAGITEMAEANRFLRELYLPLHNARFATPAEDKGSAFVPFAGALDDILCVQQERTVGNDNTVRYHGLSLHIPPARHRHHYVKARVRCTSIQTEPSPSSTAPDAWPATTPTASPSTAKPGRPRDPLRRSPPVPCGTSGQPLRARPLPHRPNHINRSGQLIWYINRSTQNVLDISNPSSRLTGMAKSNRSMSVASSRSRSRYCGFSESTNHVRMPS